MKLLEAAQRAKRPVALTGAGISAPSGVPTFQSRWKGRPIRDFLGRDYFKSHYVDFFELYCAMEQWTQVEPNEAHRALAEMEIPVITQNIDGLHQKAGSRQVLELHGNLRYLICPKCGKRLEAGTVCQKLRPRYEAGNTGEIPELLRCRCGGQLDVDVVLYGDAVREMEAAWKLAMECDLLLVIGTSLETYPAAALPDAARRAGARVLMENQDCIQAFQKAEG